MAYESTPRRQAGRTPGDERELPGTPASFWIASMPGDGFAPLGARASVDVAVVGAGITGITAATLLKDAGKTVALLESKEIVRGTSGYTTAKVTAGHRLVYQDLRKSFGDEGARMYSESQQAALERVANLVAERGLDCDFHREPHYVYAEPGDDVEKIEREAEAEQQLGLPASYVEQTPLPFFVAGALRLEDQAQFHPRKYLLPLAERIPGNGNYLFERTRVLDVDEGEPCIVHTDRGQVIARDVIVASSLPILDRGLFFAKAHPYRSYTLAAPIAPAQALDGMFINSGGSTRSIRTAGDGERLLLLVNGNGHKIGEEPHTESRYLQLQEFIRARFGIDTIAYRWSTHDYYTLDQLPYIGRLRRRSRHLYVGTGFNGWGMTGGTLAGMILSDLVLGNDNPWAHVYDANRLKVRAAASMFVKENAKVARHWAGDRLARTDAPTIDAVAPGEGAIVSFHGERIAAYRDEANTLHALSPVCTHLACYVSWNRAEKTWDCPCHGSRFTGKGDVIQGPAVRDLARVDLQRLQDD